ncbi:MAG TPA: ATP synthase F1 subunit gamma [Planctomycetota bacterium]|nr:ATP synthase F1 subunit gamma [Planctomycetota bacterium]
MAKGTKELKRRITGVKNIQQITRAMEMVATQKLKRLQMRAEAARPFAEKIQQMVARLAGSVRPELSPLLQPREVEVTASLVVSADKGLCGGYNTNLVRLVQHEIPRGSGATHAVRVLGSKGGTLLRARGIDLLGVYDDAVEKLDFTRARNIARELVADFLAGRVDEVRLIYTAFLSAASQKPAVVRLLPIQAESLRAGAPAAPAADVIIEPSTDELLRQLLPKYLEIRVYSAILESLASEFTARRNAMKQATDAADDIIGALRRQYNRARQESITKELLEVVSGAEALK